MGPHCLSELLLWREPANSAPLNSDGSPVHPVTPCPYPPAEDKRAAAWCGRATGPGDGQRNQRTLAVTAPLAHEVG
jgi:hypothetical protein